MEKKKDYGKYNWFRDFMEQYGLNTQFINFQYTKAIQLKPPLPEIFKNDLEQMNSGIKNKMTILGIANMYEKEWRARQKIREIKDRWLNKPHQYIAIKYKRKMLLYKQIGEL